VLGLTILIVFLVFLVAVIFLFGFTTVFGAPWLPTSTRIVYKMLAMVDVQPGDVLYDLGSGDGRIIVMAAQEFRATSVGIEINPFWVVWTRVKVALLKLRGKVNVVWGNFFDHDLSNANILTLYLLQDTNSKLMPKLGKELKPGTRVISHEFTFDGWNPCKVDYEANIYMYRVAESNDVPKCTT
jgi:predicted RNA methylase